tara:strand:- start:3513 stop:6257 length:2745 start_codon:yes stop_codon:yes gene_type:complete
MKKIFVSIDLETTGFDHQMDKIIEVGAVKFKNNKVLEKLSILVNPKQIISDEISELTGINQIELDSAKEWAEVKDEVVNFIGNYPIIGHNVNFENNFLRENDVKITDSYDTLSLARILLPNLPEYNLSGISKHLKFNHENPHRALSDSLVTMDLFNILINTLFNLEKNTIEILYHLSKKNKSSIFKLIQEEIDPKTISNFSKSFSIDPYSKKIDKNFQLEQLENYLPENYSLQDEINKIYDNSEELKNIFPKYEYREEQKVMSDVVSKSIIEDEEIIIEAGTGVGKSFAYLLPSLISIVKSNKKIVISTNTIPLQEQILNKDLETVKLILSNFGYETKNIKSFSLKGRSNYICIHKIFSVVENSELTNKEIEFLCKMFVWFQYTNLGEKNEINISTMENLFDQYSHKEFSSCVKSEKNCYFKAARKKANFSNFLVVNHSLLFSDLATDNSIIPKHDVLILDESHHIDDIATKNLSFDFSRYSLDFTLRRFLGKLGILKKMESINNNEIIGKKIEILDNEIFDLQQINNNLFDELSNELINIYEKDKIFRELRITKNLLDNVLIFNLNNSLIAINHVINQVLDDLATIVDNTKLKNSFDKNIINEISECLISLSNTAKYIKLLIDLDNNFVFWFDKSYEDKFSISGAPLDVSEFIYAGLFSDKKSIILTGATLNNNDNYQSFKKKLGHPSIPSITINSTYEYSENSLLVLAGDFPDRRNNYNNFVDELSELVIKKSIDLSSPMLVLCTNYELMKHVRQKIRKYLNDKNIRLLVQKFDGSAKKIIDLLNDDIPTVAIGNYTFWEGVDLQNKSFETIIMTALPFPVFTNPLHQSRSESYDNSFLEYHLPLATTKFRQGFGRLIRSKTDTGVFIVIDHRIVTKKYGRNFIESLPNPKLKITSYKNINHSISEWKLNYD